jgi:hypothetical protein
MEADRGRRLAQPRLRVSHHARVGRDPRHAYQRADHAHGLLEALHWALAQVVEGNGWPLTSSWTTPETKISPPLAWPATPREVDVPPEEVVALATTSPVWRPSLPTDAADP